MPQPPFTPQKDTWYSFLLLAADPRAIVQLEGLKSPMTSSGIKPTTFQFVAYCLNQLCHHIAQIYIYKGKSHYVCIIILSSIRPVEICCGHHNAESFSCSRGFPKLISVLVDILRCFLKSCQCSFCRHIRSSFFFLVINAVIYGFSCHTIYSTVQQGKSAILECLQTSDSLKTQFLIPSIFIKFAVSPSDPFYP
jgi:hypothetical protein